MLLSHITKAQNEENGSLVTQSSIHSYTKTVELVKSAIEEKGLKVIAEIDHAQAAAGSNLDLRPTLTLLFGNPEVGTKLMQADQRAGLDLPLRMLVWENEDGEVFVSYHSPLDLLKTYRLKNQVEVLQKMKGMLENLIQDLDGSRNDD